MVLFAEFRLAFPMRAALTLLFGTFMSVSLAVAQNIGVFQSVEPTGQTQRLVIPSTHTFQVLAQTGDTLADGSLLRTAPDFTAFVPKNGRDDLGYLSLNHEIPNFQGGVTVFDMRFNKITKRWQISNGLPVNTADFHGASRPCSGGITPWATVVYGEESIIASDLDSNGYFDSGWLVEIQPKTRQVIQKIWAAGNALHENCTFSSDQRTMYWGGDDISNGFIFKYIANEKRNLYSGNLYVLVRDDSTSSTGYWSKVPNATPTQCNNINSYCKQHGAWNFAGIEDVEIGPNGKIYFSAKYSGRVWRFKDDGFSTISQLEVFVENTEYPIQTASGVKWVQWGFGADNLAFDNANNLWVLQDGGDNNIWMVKPTHTASNPKISLFGTTPAGCEPTGITFSPYKHSMFISFQHPYPTNADTMTDVTGRRVVFNRGTTIVIGRKEYLGGVEDSTDLSGPGTSRPAPPQEVTATPNPTTSGIVTLRCAGFHEGLDVGVEIFNAAGQLRQTTHKTASHNKIDVDFQPEGFGAYRIRVTYASLARWVTVVAE